MCEQRQGQTIACACASVHAPKHHLRLCVYSIGGKMCVQMWVYVLSKSIMPSQHYSEGAPSATNAVPDHGVNNLIFNAGVHYAERSHMYHQHPLTQCGTDREGEDEEGLAEVNSGAYFSCLFQNISQKN